MTKAASPNPSLAKWGIALFKSQTAKSTYVTSSADISLAILAAVTTALIARQLAPEDFGIFITLWSFLTLVAGLLDLGIGAGIINYVARTKNINLQNQYIGSSLIFLTIIGLIQFLIISLGAPLWKFLFFPDISSKWLTLIAIGSWALILSRFINDTLRAQQRFAQSAISTITFAVLRLYFIITLLVTDYFNLYLTILIMSLSPLIYLLTGYIFLNLPWKHLRWRTKPFKQIIKFSGWLGVNQVATNASSRIDILLINRLAGSASAGIYGTASLMARIFVTITSSLLSVFAPRLVRLKKTYQQKQFLLKVIIGVGISWLGILALGLTAKPLILLIFGPNYLPSLQPFYLLLTAMGGLLTAIPVILPIIYTLKKPHIIAYFSSVQFIVILSGSFVFIPKYGLLTPAYLWIATQFLILLGGLYYLRHWLFDMHPTNQNST